MTTATATRIIRATIEHDPDAESPRSWDNLGTFVGFEHRRYEIGDRHPTDGERTALELGGWAGLERHLQRQHGAILIVPVGMIDHSGTAYYLGGGAHWSDSAGWDSGTCGFIYSAGESGVPDLRAALASELETYTAWANGDTWFYSIDVRTLCPQCERADVTPSDCPHCDVESVDSCGGFYGMDPDANGMIDQAGDEYADALRDAYNRYR